MGLNILGPIELASSTGEAIPPGSPREQIVLAALALNPNRAVLTSSLIDAVWDDAPPSTARGQIQGCVSVLRKLLSSERIGAEIITKSAGYQLVVADDALDSLQFESAVRDARRRKDVAESACALRAALDLWRGPALYGVPSDEVQRAAAPLDEARLSAADDLMQLELALGRHLEVIGDLRQTLSEHPLHEQTYANLMLALYRAGRPAEALEVMRTARSTLVAELGIDPSTSLQRLEQQILNSDPQLAFVGEPRTSSDDNDPAAPARDKTESALEAPTRWTSPRQLPRADADFVGRTCHIEQMTRLLRSTDQAPDTERFAVPIVGICGAGGVGKSTLAVRVAHELADEYPDGHLYVDLQGPMPDEGVEVHLARLLRALGLDGTAIPEDSTERAEMYRSTIADRRILLILDGVGSEDQVVPLLPGSPSCAVMIACRTRLDLLSGTHWFGLGVFDFDTSMELLGRIVGSERLESEPEATERLIRYAGGLPLALRIAGARLASRPAWRIAELTRRMENEVKRLDEFSHRGLELRSSIGTSYRTLSAESKRLFRLLALSNAPSFPTWAAGALLDVSLPMVEHRLEQLIDAHLLETFESNAGEPRYRFHDLIRMYARERLFEIESEDDRLEAAERLFGGWLDRTDRAHRAEYGGDYTTLHGNAPRYEIDDVDDDRMARCPLEWLEDERATLVSAVRQSADLGMDDVTWDLALTLVSLFEVRGLYDDWHETATIALSATERAGNRFGRAATLYSLGTLNVALKELDTARRCFDSALEIFTEDGNEHGQALTLRNDALIDRVRGDVPMMLHKSELALAKMRAVDDPIGESNILRTLARYAAETHDHDHASSLLDEARTLTLRAGHRRGAAQVETRIAETRLAVGETAEARQTLNSVLETVHELGDRVGEAHVLYLLGLSRLREGRADTAETTLLNARTTAARAGAPLVEGQVAYSLAELSIGRGAHKIAISWLDRARDIFRSLGSTVWLARTLVLSCDMGPSDSRLDELGSDLETVLTTLQEIGSAEATVLCEQLAAWYSQPGSDSRSDT